jgi:hypothetical protein
VWTMWAELAERQPARLKAIGALSNRHTHFSRGGATGDYSGCEEWCGEGAQEPKTNRRPSKKSKRDVVGNLRAKERGSGFAALNWDVV